VISGVHHLTLRVRDLERSRAFYRDVLGLELDQDFAGEKVRFRIPGATCRLVLHPPVTGTPVDDRFDEHRIGLDHIALGVEAASDLTELARLLIDAGLPADLHHDRSGAPMLTFRDPDNVQWELFLQG
jgi:catechol 2,3-dioxygenase-like lactoylglutathione lyase family enzyme